MNPWYTAIRRLFSLHPNQPPGNLAMHPRRTSLLSLFLIACILPVSAAERFPYQSQESLTLYLGKVETLRIGDIERVAVGNEALLSTSILSTSELLIIPRQAGQTDLVIWQAGNRKQLLHLKIQPANPGLLLRDTRLRLSLYPHLVIGLEDANVVVRGVVSSKEQLDNITQRLSPDLINLVSVQVTVDASNVIRQTLGHIDGLEITSGEDWIKLSGYYLPEFQPVIDLVTERFPHLINTAQPDPAKIRAMVVVDVQIIEIRRRNLEKLGIRWENAIAGPAAGVVMAGSANPYFRAFSKVGEAERLATSVPVNDTASYSSVGLVSHIGSTIELMKNSGEARMLARPLLSTRDGTPSSFHSGGEIPYPIIDARTGNIAVDFRAYGVMLTILPRVSKDKDLMVEIEAEVSSIDNAISINGVPGLVSKSVKSVVNTREGDTIVMSGLLSTEDDQSESAVPLLGDIPLLGALFRSTSDDNNQRELAIFLTPRLSQFEGAVEATPLDQLGDHVTRQIEPLDWLDSAVRE